MTLQGDDDGTQTIALTLDAGDGRGMLGALDDEKGAQRFGICRKIIALGHRTFGLSDVRGSAKPPRARRVNLSQLLCRLRRPNLDLPDARPVETFDQSRELGWRQPHDAVLDLRPTERSLLEPLSEQAKPSPVPEDQLHAIGAFGAEHEDRTRIGIGAQMLLHHCRQAVHALSEVYRPGRNQHPSPTRYCDHADLNAPRTARSIRSSIRPRTVTRAPPGKAISIVPASFASTLACATGIAGCFRGSAPPLITTGTSSGNVDASPLSLGPWTASRRQL